MTQPIRIALTGTQGAGKTTLARLLAPKLGVEVIDVSRPTAAARRLGFQKASEVPADQMELFQWMGLFEQVHAERAACERPGGTIDVDRPPFAAQTVTINRLRSGFVADRSVIDFMAYYRLQVPRAQWDTTYFRLAFEHARRNYDAILVLPPNSKGLIDNGIRHMTDPIVVQQEMLAVIDEFGLDDLVIRVYEDTPELRLTEVLLDLPLNIIKAAGMEQAA